MKECFYCRKKIMIHHTAYYCCDPAFTICSTCSMEKCPRDCARTRLKHQFEKCSKCSNLITVEEAFMDFFSQKYFCRSCIMEKYRIRKKGEIKLTSTSSYSQPEIKAYLDSFCGKCQAKLDPPLSYYDQALHLYYCYTCVMKDPHIDPPIVCAGCTKTIKKAEKRHPITEGDALCTKCHHQIHAQIQPTTCSLCQKNLLKQDQRQGQEPSVCSSCAAIRAEKEIKEEKKEEEIKEEKKQEKKEEKREEKKDEQKKEGRSLEKAEKVEQPRYPNKQQNSLKIWGDQKQKRLSQKQIQMDKVPSRRKQSDEILEDLKTEVSRTNENELIPCSICQYELDGSYAIMGTHTESIMCRGCFVLQSKQQIGFRKMFQPEEEEPRSRHFTANKNLGLSMTENKGRRKEDPFSIYQPAPLPAGRLIGTVQPTRKTHLNSSYYVKCDLCSKAEHRQNLKAKVIKGKPLYLCPKCIEKYY